MATVHAVAAAPADNDEGDGEGDDDGRATANCFTAWQGKILTVGKTAAPTNAVAEEDSHKIDLENST